MYALTERPSTLFDFDVLAEITGHDGVLAFEPDIKFLLRNHDHEVACAGPLRNGHYDVNVLQGLFPRIRQG